MLHAASLDGVCCLYNEVVDHLFVVPVGEEDMKQGRRRRGREREREGGGGGGGGEWDDNTQMKCGASAIRDVHAQGWLVAMEIVIGQ